MSLFRASQPLRLLAKDTFSFRQKYWVRCKQINDPLVIDFFFERFMRAWYFDAPAYNYIWVSGFAIGIVVVGGVRFFFYDPSVVRRKGELAKNVADRHRTNAYSLPFYNHTLRNYSMRFRASLVDNEPDYTGDHPWGIRPARNLSTRRSLCLFSLPVYVCDDPLFEKTTHNYMERFYESIGYYGKTKFKYGIQHDSLETDN